MICKYNLPMSGIKAKDGIRAKARARDGFQQVHFEEYPGHWIITPEKNREKALSWAKRNRERLINKKIKDLAFYCHEFFYPSGPWANRMRAKGHTFVDKYLITRQGHLDNYFIPAFGDADPRTIRRREIDNWLLALTKPSGGKLAGATKNKILYSIALVFEDLRDQEVVEMNPIDGIKPYSKAPVKPRGVIDRESLGKLYPASHGELVQVWGSTMWAAMMCLFNDTGSRPGELRALTWEDIDIQRRFVPIRKGVEAGTVDKIKGTKTGVVKAGFLTARTVQELQIWQAESRYNDKTDFVFTANGKTPVTSEGILKAFRRGLAEVGINNSDWTPYWLRHSFGTYQLENLSQDELMRLMGHNSTVTSRIYQHPDDETLYRAASGIQEKLDKAREN